MTKKKPAVTGTTTQHQSAGATAVAEPPVTPAAIQKRHWGEAMHLFGQRRFAEACDSFRAVATGPDSQIADKARSYLQICERKVGGAEIQLRTAEDHFSYGVERMNARDPERARQHLNHALALEPRGDYILYALALCSGFSGDGNGACENLRRAIAIDPRNRVLARQDAEFVALASQFPALRAILSSEEK